MQPQLIIRRTLGVALVATLGVAIAIFEPHRHVLAAVWPIVTDFFNYLTA